MEKPISVLLVEDNEQDAELNLLSLRRGGFEVAHERVDTADALAEALKRRDWDIVLSDYSMPSFSCRKAWEIVRGSGRRCPFIVVSGAIDEETTVELMRSGIHDCIMKERMSRLTPAVVRELGEARMRRERESALESLRRELTLNTTLAELSKNLIAMPEDIEYVSGLVLKYAKNLTGSLHGYVGVIHAKTGSMFPLTLTEMFGKECSVPGESTFSRREDGTYPSLWGHALNTRRAFFENSPATHPSASGIPPGHVSIEKFLSAPVMAGSDLVGQISVANPGRDYTEQDLIAVERLGDLFSIAVTNHRTLMEKEQLSAQLRKVQKIEVIGTLAEGIAHDFNNILTPMIGYAEMVQLCLSRDSKVWKHQEQVLKACSRARELVQQILSLSRQTEERMKPVPLAPVVEEALRLLQSSLPSTIAIRRDIDPACGLVLSVPSQFHQVVMNLCTNAYQAMREKGGVLSVSFKPVRVSDPDAGSVKIPGDYVRLEIGDTGHGMDRKTMEKIFDPYFTTKEKGEGTGLGLSIVDSIVRKHGGTIGVYSEPGCGTSFHVYLPVVTSEGYEREEASANGLSLRGKERILIVDDVWEIASMAKEMLEGLGYDVTAYTSSTEALRDFSSDPSRHDLVITDLTMPDITGIGLSRRMLDIRPDLPIILCSGLDEPTIDRAMLPAGIRKFLKKPLLFRDFSLAVRQVLDEEPPFA